jgi:hypothetical protein
MRPDESGTCTTNADGPTFLDEQAAAKVREYLHLVDLAGIYHDEAVQCAQAGCFLAACVMTGAMLEAGLLVMTMALETDLKTQGLWPPKDTRPPDKWSLTTLVDLALRAGWLETTDLADEAGVTKDEVRDVITLVKDLRDSAAHPGRHARETRENTVVELSQDTYEAAYRIVRTAFDYTYAVLDCLQEKGDNPAT